MIWNKMVEISKVENLLDDMRVGDYESIIRELSFGFF
jgi:hypothetical protein